MPSLRKLLPLLHDRSTVLAVITVALVAVATLLGLFEYLELKAIDAAFTLRGPLPPTAPIIIVAVDDESIRETNIQWPWPRQYMADLITRISSGGPKSITTDIFWYEPSSDPAGDAALAQAIATAGNVILANDINHVEQAGFVLDEYRRPLPELEQAALRLGLANLYRDPDGFVRQMPLYLVSQEQAYFSWAAITAFNYLGLPLPEAVQPNAVITGFLTIPLEGNRIIVNYHGPAGSIFRQIPAYQILNGDQNPAQFKGAIVLIGVTSEVQHDTYPVPFEGSRLPMPGVEVNANVIDTIISGQFVNRWPASAGALAALALGLLAYLFSTANRPLLGLGLTALAGLGYAAAWGLAFANARTEIYLIAPFVSLVLGYAVPSVERAAREALEKRRVRAIFERFISPEMADQLIERGIEGSRGRRAELTILFSDIRGFTTMSEKMTPEQVVDILNEYLGLMTDVILKHGGTIDKYEGDLIMAFFNAPLPQPDHALRAVRAAIDMRQALDRLRDKWAREAGPTRFEMGIGINTGEAFVGLLGSEKRINYTCIGDSVNLASRVQDLTKDLKWPLLITEYTYEKVKAEFDAEFGEARLVKGKTQPVGMYKVLGSKGAPESEKVRPLFE
ncbi:MAG: adenylate/guanylate cyclase domain-containing protein [Chloroflexi bacterium]|nr:adenylate/guanylate cyclase domain-containing protein [Chloroflexota bacterium]